MLHSIATVSISGTLESKLRIASEAGYRAVEIFDTDLVASTLSPRDVRKLLDDLGLACILYQPFRDFEGMPTALRQRGLDRARFKFDVMQELGCDRLLVCSNCSPAASGDHGRIVDDLRLLGDAAGEAGIQIGYEALAWGVHVRDHRVAWELVKEADHPNVGILLDSFHSLSRDIPSSSIREIDKNKLVFVQLADAPILDMNHLYWSRHFRNLPGQGNFDLTGYLAEILKTGYEGPISLEIFNDRFRASSAMLVARDGLRSLAALEDAGRRAVGMAPMMPARARIERVEFIEFAVMDADREAIETLLRSAGFDRIGGHRTKAVELWRGGKANIVLNFEEAGFSSAYRLTHGTAISAVGLVVSDGAATMDRARALGMHDYATDIAPMPALRGVGGSLVYILDHEAAKTIWIDEFQLEPGINAGPDVGIEAIDHLACSVPVDEYLSWQLYFRSLFDVTVQSPHDVIDPNGLVQSQAIQNADGSFRLTLNATDAREALSNRFIHQSFGAGFQHVALRVADLGAAARALAARGLVKLPIPENYTADAAARLGLSTRDANALREHDMLIDVDDEGHRYRQIYSRAFDRSFFFEFVERLDYDGYGAPNAAVRLAAQTQYKPALDAL